MMFKVFGVDMKDLIDAAIRLKDVMEFADKVVDDNFPEKIAEIVKFHSKGAAGAALASAWIPGAGATAAAAISAGFIWTMYGKINNECKIPFGENVMKSLASGVATNLASYAVASLVMGTALSLFPGIGSIGATAVIATTCYALTLASGLVYIKLLTTLISDGIDPTTVSEADLKRRANNATQETNVKDVMKKAKDSYKNE